MSMFKIVEERGCDIEYHLFHGTYEECQKEVEKILIYQDAEDPTDSYANYHNGKVYSAL